MKLKNLLLLLSFTLLIACQIKLTENQDADKDDFTEFVIEIDTSLLKGVWQDSINAPNARFRIKDSTVYFPGQAPDLSEFKYTLVGDSFTILKPNITITETMITGKVNKIVDLTEFYKVEKLTTDTLVLSSGNHVCTLVKSEE